MKGSDVTDLLQAATPEEVAPGKAFVAPRVEPRERLARVTFDDVCEDPFDPACDCARISPFHRGRSACAGSGPFRFG